MFVYFLIKVVKIIKMVWARFAKVSCYLWCRQQLCKLLWQVGRWLKFLLIVEVSIQPASWILKTPFLNYHTVIHQATFCQWGAWKHIWIGKLALKTVLLFKLGKLYFPIPEHQILMDLSFVAITCIASLWN